MIPPRSLESWLKEHYEAYLGRAEARGRTVDRKEEPGMDEEFMERIGDQLIRIWKKAEENNLT